MEILDKQKQADDILIVGGCPHDQIYIAPTPVAPDGLLYQLNRAGITSRTPEHFITARDDRYSFHLLHCVLSGQGSVTLRGTEYPLHGGQMFLLPAHEAHTYASLPADPMGLAWVEFAGGDSNQIANHIISAAGPVLNGEIFQDVLDVCTSFFSRTSTSLPETSAILYNTLMRLCGALPDEGALNHETHAILRYIDTHLGEHLTLTLLAKEFGYHPAYFSSYFTRTVGLNFSKYLLQRRIRHACHLLESTQYPIERIAQELGFYDISHFIQRFKSVENTTPSKYRRQRRAPADGAVRKRAQDE